MDNTTTTAPLPIPPIFSLPQASSTSLILLFMLALAFLAVVLVIALTYGRRSPADKFFPKELKDADYVGIYYDISSRRIYVLPMKAIKNVLYYIDKDRKYMLVAPHTPEIEIYWLGDKPAVTLIGSNYIAMPQNITKLFGINKALIALETNSGEIITTNHKEIVDTVLHSLLKEVSTVKGHIPIASEYKLAFTINKSALFDLALLQSIEPMRMVVATMSDVFRALDQFYLGLLKRYETIERIRTQFPLALIIIGMIALVIVGALILMSGRGP